jgi:autotransporter passenger strand-loop-strand repeat protein
MVTTVNSGGTEIVGVFGGGAASGTTVNGGGFEIVSAGGTVTGTTVDSGGFLYVSSGGVASSVIVNSGGTVYVYSGGSVVSATVASGGAIDLAYVPYASGGTADLDSTTDILTVTESTGSATVQMSGSYTGLSFHLVQDTTGGTLITAAGIAPCYCLGARILTDRGEVAVEDLRIGDHVHTVLGESEEPIMWIGHRRVDCAHHPKPRQVWPVRVAAGAFGAGQPHSDLFLSPDHAVYINEVLIPVKYLVNDSTIVQVPVDHVTYYHVELPHHEVVLAQGLAAESYLDTGDRSNFENGDAPIALYPDFSARMWEALGCAPLIVTGPELDAARALVGSFATRRSVA